MFVCSIVSHRLPLPVFKLGKAIVKKKNCQLPQQPHNTTQSSAFTFCSLVVKEKT
jgi:hypothetical protein